MQGAGGREEDGVVGCWQFKPLIQSNYQHNIEIGTKKRREEPRKRKTCTLQVILVQPQRLLHYLFLLKCSDITCHLVWNLPSPSSMDYGEEVGR